MIDIFRRFPLCFVAGWIAVAVLVFFAGCARAGRSVEFSEDDVVLADFPTNWVFFVQRAGDASACSERRLMAVLGRSKVIEIRNTGELARTVRRIGTAEDAMGFVRFITDPRVVPLLEDVDYYEPSRQRRNFTAPPGVLEVDPYHYRIWQMSPPRCSRNGSLWIVERDLVRVARRGRPQQLFRCVEFVGPHGGYRIEFARLLASNTSIEVPPAGEPAATPRPMEPTRPQRP